MTNHCQQKDMISKKILLLKRPLFPPSYRYRSVVFGFH